jgi:hypothetical protein
MYYSLSSEVPSYLYSNTAIPDWKPTSAQQATALISPLTFGNLLNSTRTVGSPTAADYAFSDRSSNGPILQSPEIPIFPSRDNLNGFGTMLALLIVIIQRKRALSGSWKIIQENLSYDYSRLELIRSYRNISGGLAQEWSSFNSFHGPDAHQRLFSRFGISGKQCWTSDKVAIG